MTCCAGTISRGYPPSGAVNATPGYFTPKASKPPANLTALRALGPLGETTAWTTGQYVLLGDATHAYWNGTQWNAGNAP